MTGLLLQGAILIGFILWCVLIAVAITSLVLSLYGYFDKKGEVLQPKRTVFSIIMKLLKALVVSVLLIALLLLLLWWWDPKIL